MAHYVQIPKDLNDIKQKFMFNLTKRQVVSFSIGFVAGVPDKKHYRTFRRNYPDGLLCRTCTYLRTVSEKRNVL